MRPAASLYFSESGQRLMSARCMFSTIVRSSRGDVQMCGSMPWLWLQWWCEQVPPSVVMPSDRSTTLSPMLCVRLCSKLISPVESIISALLRRAMSDDVGSKVSGLAPCFTSSSTLKSPHVSSSARCCSGAIVTNMVFSLSPDFCVAQATESRAMVAICRNLFIFSIIVVTKL